MEISPSPSSPPVKGGENVFKSDKTSFHSFIPSPLTGEDQGQGEVGVN